MCYSEKNFSVSSSGSLGSENILNVLLTCILTIVGYIWICLYVTLRIS